ncbi:urease accessory protein UreD [Krasilnikoviella flava]|uniref:Urease accessory protein n=1 Tax=Krasilnikoviella flava TaxID=526729 RepID=A0A1T5JC25_9MICO|nr:urease accessory protein UreD [Krasilnikoviella flava]SKC48949.1 urease accessory protein [Krasilnikoviella flava]
MSTPPRTDVRLTSVEVDRGTVPGAPVRVRTRDDLLAVRTVARGAEHAEVALVATGAVLLGGDHVAVRVHVADGCALTLTDVGGTVAYDGDGASCRWDVEVRLGAGARLAWAGLPFVVSTGADVTRSTDAVLGAGARLLLRETVVLGRDGERGGRVVLRSTVHDDRGPLLVEEVVAAGERPVPGVLGGRRVIDTVTDLRGAPDDAPAPPGPLPGTDGAVTLRLERGGTLTRWLGASAHLSPLHRSHRWRDHPPGTGPAPAAPCLESA